MNQKSISGTMNLNNNNNKQKLEIMRTKELFMQTRQELIENDHLEELHQIATIKMIENAMWELEEMEKLRDNHDLG